MAVEQVDYAGEFFQKALIPIAVFTAIAIIGFFALTYFITAIIGAI